MKTYENKTRLPRFASACALPMAMLAAVSLGACSDSGDDDAEQADAASNGVSVDAAPGGASDAMSTGPDAMAVAVQIPAWTREDIQPNSPKFGEVYGLSEFNGKILVAVLVQGF